MPNTLKLILSIVFIATIFTLPVNAQDQKVSVKEEPRTILTYPYGDPNPIPTYAINAQAGAYYPYFIFDGFSDVGEDQDWKVVTLENDFIEVTVLPEVGGKVMGAIEKSTGEEFIYLNHVMKFRSIGVRGPWTSGGIEHNFGLDLGHAPWTAADVDYVLKTNEDGSESCVVGGIDLASRTQWRVDIRLPKDKAYFQTNAMWYNPTPLHDAYLSWEVAAYKGTDDLQFYFPGDYYIGHPGDVHPWPIDDEGHNISLYRENDFGSNKSYHVSGAYPNWFGGYFHDASFGSGHWSPYDESPGKKIWIWSPARSGARWEDLLTDNDGQYIEAQSGVKLNQAGPRSGYVTPYNQLFMRPFYTEKKSDYWFPVKQTGGIVDATPSGTLNTEVTTAVLKVTYCPNIYIKDTLKIFDGERLLFKEAIDLAPMEIYTAEVSLGQTNPRDIKITIDDMLDYTADPEVTKIDRPNTTPAGQNPHSAEHKFRMAEDQYSMRSYEAAIVTYKECLEVEPTHSRALGKVAELYYRRGAYEKGLEYAYRALENNTYDPPANFIAGVIHTALDNRVLAKEYFSIAVRSMEYRSAAYAELGRLFCKDKNFKQGLNYAEQAIDYNKYNMVAHEVKLAALRKLNRKEMAAEQVSTLLDLDPLSHWANFEQYLLAPSDDGLKTFNSAIRNELPQETYLELAMSYLMMGLESEAIKVLEQSVEHPMVSYWLAYLYRDRDTDKSKSYLEAAVDQSPKFVFPFRLETEPVLKWARAQDPSWKTNYYLGLLYWKMLRKEDAKDAFERCGDEPDYSVFYTVRGVLNKAEDGAMDDFKKATQLEPGEWRTWYYLMDHYQQEGDYVQQWETSKVMYSKFSDNPSVGIGHARALLNVGRYKECLDVLAKVNVLPAEFSNSGHVIYELASLGLALDYLEKKKYKLAMKYIALSREWPENMGPGKPYNPDNRLQDFILAYCEKQLGNDKEAEKLYDQILDFANRNWGVSKPAFIYLNIWALQREGKSAELKEKMISWQEELAYQKDWSLSGQIDSKEVKWVLARYEGDDSAAEKFADGVIGEQPKNYFGLVLRTLDIIK